MKLFKKMSCLVLALLLAVCLFGCGKKDGGQTDAPVDSSSYVGTWKGSDHDGENVVHYLIFDADGYWNVYMNYETLTKAIKQLPDQLVSFKIFRQIQNSGQTGCHFEYVKNEGESRCFDLFSFDDDGNLAAKDNADVTFVRVSDYAGEPDATMVAESRDLFDRAREEALLNK